MKIIWKECKNLAFPDILSRSVSIKDLDKYQLKHKKIPRDNKFYDESGNEEKYFVLRDNEKGQKNGCYPILKQTFQGIKKLNFENEQFFQTNYKPSDRICSISDISESFLKGNAIYHYREKLPLKEPILSEEDDSENYYSDLCLEFDDNLEKEKEQFEKISTEDDPLLNSVELSDLEIDDISLEQEIEASKPSFNRIASVRLAKPIYENIETSDGKELIEKLSSFGKDIDLNITAISHEQFKDPVIQSVRQLFESGNKDEKNVKFRQSKAMKTYMDNFKNLCLIGNILCTKQPTEDPNIQNIKICAPLSLFLKIFELAHQDSLSGHSGKDKTLSSIKRFFYWPGLYKWVSHFIANCSDCQKNKQKRKDINEAPLEKYRNCTFPLPHGTYRSQRSNKSTIERK